MTSIDQVVIVGGGLAGAKTAEALRDQGYGDRVILLAGEAQLPYERPPLSKTYLAGASTFEDTEVHPAKWYADNEIDLRLATRATAVDVGARSVLVDDTSPVGTSSKSALQVPYDRLILATGSSPRRLNLPGGDAEGVLYLRTRNDSDAIKSELGPDRHLVIIGAGWIGLEVAATARGAGTAVTIIESADLPLLGILGAELAEVFADLHREHQVDLRLDSGVTEILTDGGKAVGVRLRDGTRLSADAVVIGVGASPNLDVAESAHLGCENGVLVDAGLRSSNPDILAVGDIANHDHPILHRRIRVEHWATALTQPAVAVASALGKPASYDDLPYFFSDQYDLGMEYLGHASFGAYDQIVIRGDLNSVAFVAFWLDARSRVLASMNVNVWDVVDDIRPLILSGKRVDPAALADTTTPFSEL